LLTLISVVLIVIVFYFVNFNTHILKDHTWWNVYQNLSKDTGVWGTFGDYVGGILNPVIAAFAFYLIAKTYELQKTELEETRKLLEVSTNAQKDQIKLAALTALLNSNFTRISLLEAEMLRLLESKSRNPEPKNPGDIHNVAMSILRGDYGKYTKGREDYIKEEINNIFNKNNELISEIEGFSKK
jgi:large-conductance mechanosensitive channel